MTRDDIRRMARETIKTQHFHGYQHSWTFLDSGLEYFATLVAAAEREACAVIAESYEPTCDSCPSGVANAIRARGKP